MVEREEERKGCGERRVGEKTDKNGKGRVKWREGKREIQ